MITWKRGYDIMKPELIIMLTNNDITVSNAMEVFESCKDLPYSENYALVKHESRIKAKNKEKKKQG